MTNFSYPDQKLREKLGEIIKKEVEKARFDKEKDPFYQDHIKWIKEIMRKY